MVSQGSWDVQMFPPVHLCQPILSVDTQRCVYLATIVATLLYGSETWAVNARQVQHLEVFHNRCVREILEVT